MKIYVTQRHGIRYFTKFADLAERDKLEIELRIDDKDERTVTIDLTTALIEEYSKHPEIGKLSRDAGAEVVGLQPLAPLVVRKSKTVSPAYLSESKKPKDDIIARVREAQIKAAEERKAKQAQAAADRAERLAAARAAKQSKVESGGRRVEKEKLKAESGKQKAGKVEKPKAESGKRKAAADKVPKGGPAAAKLAGAAKQAPPAKKPKAIKKTETAGLTKTQQAAIKKIGAALAKEEKDRPRPAAKKPAPAAKKAPARAAPKPAASTRKPTVPAKGAMDLRLIP